VTKSFDIDLSEYVPFEHVSDAGLLKARLFHKCRMSETGCWVWTGTKDTGGYGMISHRSKYQKAHRISFLLFKGEVPKGLHVLHACDNVACINPAHLRAGTVKENMADRDARGRRDVRGEQIGTSKLKTVDILEIRASSLGPKALSEKYGVTPAYIWRIRTGKNWKHLENLNGR
jgi:hypothetical protein